MYLSLSYTTQELLPRVPQMGKAAQKQKAHQQSNLILRKEYQTVEDITIANASGMLPFLAFTTL